MSDLVEEWMFQGFAGLDSLGVVELEHLVEEVEGLWVLNLAELGPSDLLFLHFLWDEATISIFERNFLDGIATKEAC